MKKIAVLTWFNRGRNYGQTLQAFALNHTLRRMGYQCTFLSYGRNGPRLTEEEINGLTGNARDQQREFTRFIKEHIDYSSRLREAEDVRKYLQENSFDVALCGSDQIWNYLLSSFEPLYMFDFPLSCSKVAYAPGMMDMGQFSILADYPSMSTWLEDFSAVSVRENASREIVKKITQGKVCPEVVLDPTLLLTQKEWLEEVVFPEVEWENYLFCYMFDMSPAQQELAQRVARERGCATVVYIDALGRGVPEFPGIECVPVKCASIEQFLSLIYHARAMVTDSFHGVVFSILFEREFLALENPVGGPERNLDRILTLLEKAGISDRLVRMGSEDMASAVAALDYLVVNTRLALERQESLLWLKNVIEM